MADRFKVGDRVEMLRSEVGDRYENRSVILLGTVIRIGAETIEVQMDVDNYIGNWYSWRFKLAEPPPTTPFEQDVVAYIQSELGSGGG